MSVPYTDNIYWRRFRRVVTDGLPQFRDRTARFAKYKGMSAQPQDDFTYALVLLSLTSQETPDAKGDTLPHLEAFGFAAHVRGEVTGP